MEEKMINDQMQKYIKLRSKGEKAEKAAFRSELNELFLKDSNIRDGYTQFIDAMVSGADKVDKANNANGTRNADGTNNASSADGPAGETEHMEGFFSQPYTKMIKARKNIICLTPCYAISFDPELCGDESTELKIAKYKDVRVYDSPDCACALDIYFGKKADLQCKIEYKNPEEKAEKEKAIKQYLALMDNYFYGEAIEMGISSRWRSRYGSSWKKEISNEMRIAQSSVSSAIKKAELDKEKAVMAARLFGTSTTRKNFTVENGVIKKYDRTIKDVVVPKGLGKVVGPAFQNTDRINSIVLPEGIEEIQKQAFGWCRNLKKITIPQTVKSIKNEAFIGCTNLVSITLPEGIKSIPKRLFAHCRALEEVIIPGTVTSIGQEAFIDCPRLRRIVLPDSVRTIGIDTFKGCSSLERVSMGSKIKVVPDYLFSGLESLREVIVSQDIKEIGRRSFAECPELKGIYTAENNTPAFHKLERVGERAFYHCGSFCDLEIDDQTEWHRKNCFDGTPWLKARAEAGYIIDGDYLENYTGKDEITEIPVGVTTIGREAFCENTYIKEVRIPYGVCEIGASAFARCENLRIIYIPDSVTAIADTAFKDDKHLIIRCSRDSAASKFQRAHGFQAEYVPNNIPKEENTWTNWTEK